MKTQKVSTLCINIHYIIINIVLFRSRMMNYLMNVGSPTGQSFGRSKMNSEEI